MWVSFARRLVLIVWKTGDSTQKRKGTGTSGDIERKRKRSDSNEIDLCNIIDPLPEQNRNKRRKAERSTIGPGVQMWQEFMLMGSLPKLQPGTVICFTREDVTLRLPHSVVANKANQTEGIFGFDMNDFLSEEDLAVGVPTPATF